MKLSDEVGGEIKISSQVDSQSPLVHRAARGRYPVVGLLCTAITRQRLIPQCRLILA
jgi:hypothetical protein